MDDSIPVVDMDNAETQLLQISEDSSGGDEKQPTSSGANPSGSDGDSPSRSESKESDSDGATEPKPSSKRASKPTLPAVPVFEEKPKPKAPQSLQVKQ